MNLYRVAYQLSRSGPHNMEVMKIAAPTLPKALETALTVLKDEPERAEILIVEREEQNVIVRREP